MSMRVRLYDSPMTNDLPDDADDGPDYDPDRPSKSQVKRDLHALLDLGRELVDLFEHLERELDASGFFFPPTKKAAMVRNIRAMILSSRLTDQQARTIRGMIVALVRNKYRGEQK